MLDAETTLEELEALRWQVGAERDSHIKQLACTPIGDKAKIRALRAAISACDVELRRTKPQLQHLRAAEERKETQYLWSAGVRAVCGADALKQVYDWMRAEKRRREIEGVRADA